MKVILTQDLKGRGTEGDVIEVARGFAVNYLFPRKAAVEATAGNLKQLELRRGNIEKRKASRKAEAEGLAGALVGKKVVIEARAGEDGRLFGSVTASMVEDAIREQFGIDVDRKRIDLHQHGIKVIGDHQANVSLFEGVKVEVTVEVVREGEAGAAQAAAEAPAPEAEVVEAEVADTVAPMTDETVAEAESDESGEPEADQE